MKDGVNMQRVKTILIYVFIFGFIFLSAFGELFAEFFGETNWNSDDYARITEVDYKAVVVDEPSSKGKVIITERLTFDIHAASKNNLFWELWRDLPEEYIDGVKVDYKVNSVKQIFDDGREPKVFTESLKLYWNDSDYTQDATYRGLGPGKWHHSEGPYSEYQRQYECVFIYVDGLYRETVTFEIEYEMNNAALRWNDSSELYLSMYSEDTIKYLTSFKGQILFPLDKMPRKGNYYANTYGTNAHSFPFTESTTKNPGYHTFSFELNESQLKFRPYNQYIEFALVSHGADKHIFTEYASRNSYYNDNVLDELRAEQTEYESLPSRFKTTKTVILLLFLAGTFLTIKMAFGTDKKMRKKHIFYKPEMSIDYFRDIPSDLDPNFARELVFCKHKTTDGIQDGYAGTMLSLVRKGCIELEKINSTLDWNDKNIKIVIKDRPLQQELIIDSLNPNQLISDDKLLTQTEEQYFNLILRYSNENEISISEFQAKVTADYENTTSFVDNIKSAITNIGVSQGYFQKADYRKHKKQLKRWSLTLRIIGILFIVVGNFISYQTRLDLAFGSFFIIGIGFIVSSRYLNKISSRYTLLTQFGENEYAKWRGLYNFLNSETLMRERTVVELVIWEQYLVYATAFGISEKVIKAIKIRCPNADMSPILRNPYYRSRNFYYSSRSFSSATRIASFTSRSGGHGGYGGRRSRRPEAEAEDTKTLVDS